MKIQKIGQFFVKDLLNNEKRYDIIKLLLFIVTHAQLKGMISKEDNLLKSIYEQPSVVIERFEETDLITESPSEFDGVGYIPDEWLGSWNA